jgi:HAMP domain-containing protein
MRSKGIGLRIKFTLFVIIIVLAVVVMVALPLGKFMLDTQKRNLLTGLKQQASVLLASLDSGARSFLPASNTLELGLLPDQRTAMDDAVFVTITGKSSRNEEGYDYLWASDDRNIYSKLDSDQIIPGLSPLNDSISVLIPDLEKEINGRGAVELKEFVEQVEKLGGEARRIVIRGGNEERLQELQKSISEIDSQIQKGMKDIGKSIRSYPDFDTESKVIEDRTYLFYKPIIYRQTGDETYYRGLVRLSVSTARIINEIENSNQVLIRQTLIIAAFAILIGIIGSLILSAIIISPIKKLMRGVEIIRDTEDKEELKNVEINVKTRDEIDMLAQTINQMKDGLVKAAGANKDLIGGKDIQKNFIPLDKKSDGTKKSTGSKTTDELDLFCYYEGAKGVSGDYIDYMELDKDNIVIIKCDVSGKGVAGALIMVEVASFFRNHFKKWDGKVTLKKLIIDINDRIEERDFKGRFAALILIQMNVKTGECWFCHAGDNLIRHVDSQEKQVNIIELDKAPASGMFDSSMVADSFKQVKYNLKKGDSLFFFTDGIEESKCYFRNEKFENVECREHGLADGDTHCFYSDGIWEKDGKKVVLGEIEKVKKDNVEMDYKYYIDGNIQYDLEDPDNPFFQGAHLYLAKNEEFGLKRIDDIINAVTNKSIYKLEKSHQSIKEDLTFDYSSTEGTIEDVVMALLSIERIYRIYRDSSATTDNLITVDKKIDSFLNKTFDQYRKYFEHKLEIDKYSDYIGFSHMKQDDQYDDLTILAVRRK